MKKININLFATRIHFGILLVLGTVVCLAFSSYFLLSSQAQDVFVQTDTKTTESPLAGDLNSAFSNLISIAQEKGAVRVIIGLKFDGFKPVGELGAAERQRQQTDIKKVQNDFLARLASYNVKEVKQFEFMAALAVEVNAAVLEKMRDDTQIESIQEDELQAPALAESVSLVGVPTAWSAGFSGSGWAVAILDSGVDKNHPFLSGKVISEACYSTTSAQGFSTSVCPGGVSQSTATNSGLNCNTSIQGCAHGTHVAGIAAGRGTSFSGVAKDAGIIAIQVFSRVDSSTQCNTLPSPCALTYVSDYIRGLERVLSLSGSMNIAAANMSLGGGQYSSNCDASVPTVKTAIDNLRSVGIATTIASGNSSYTNSMGSPACISSAVSVGNSGDGSFANGSTAALNQVMNDSNSASFLNLLAPGRWINSSVPGGGYDNYNGTSMAAPHVAGTWAVLKQKKPTATVTEILNALTSTGQPITDTRNGIVKPRIRVDAALQALSGGGGCTAVASISPGQTVNGSLASSDCIFTGTTRYLDAYSFNGTAGQKVAVSMNSAAFDTFLYLINSSTQTLAEDDDGGGGTNSRIPATSGYFTLPATGTYSIYATSYGPDSTGAYSLSLVNEVNCTYSITPTSQSFSASGGSGSANVTSQSGCNWTATSTASWITITSGVSGSSNGAVGFSVAANTSTSSRSGTITIAGQTFTVSQSGTTATCSSPTNIVTGQTINGSLQNGDCLYTDNSYYDAYTFSGTAGQQIFVTMNSTQFDTYLILFQGNYPGGSLISDDDNGGGGTNARIPAGSGFLTLPATGSYTILANSLTAGLTGNYTLFLGTTVATATRKTFDFDGDGKADVAVFRPSNGVWYLNQSANGFTGVSFGQSGDKIVPADYDGDRKTDAAVYRNGTWYLNRSSFGFTGVSFGAATDIPVPADYDGDGKAELAVYRPSNGTWYIYNLANNQTYGVFFGAATDKPVPADYDGDGKADVAVFRPSNGTWYLQRSQLGFTGIAFGDSNDSVVPADYDGDGKTDVAVFRPSNGAWYLNRSQLGFTGMTFGISSDLPTPADFDGDGKADIAVFRSGTWYLQRSQTGFTGMSFGTSGDKPISNAFVQ